MRARLLLPLVLLMLTSVPACREYVIVRFDQKVESDKKPLKIFVRAVAPQHDEAELSAMDQTVGYRDVPGSMTITTRVCDSERKLLAWMENRSYTVSLDEIRIDDLHMTIRPGDEDWCCSYQDQDQDGHCLPNSGTGGSSGSGGSTGTGGMSGAGGAGTGGIAAGTGGIAAGTGGWTAAGGAGGGGPDGGDDADGLCGDTHQMSICAAPQPGEIPQMPALSADCQRYCDEMVGTSNGDPLCPAVYASVAQCQRYCAMVGWTQGSATGSADTIGCRERYIKFAQMPGTSLKDSFCVAAGPTGGDAGDVKCGQGCQNFCSAWAKICNRNYNDCMAACPASSLTEPACRYGWLMRATTDRGYCDLVGYAAQCLLPDCDTAQPGG